jgi:hypothetical protein
MSVAPTWTDLPSWRVPERLASKIRGASGNKDADRIWSLGTGGFIDSPVAAGLCLRVDEPKRGVNKPEHGNVEPDVACSLDEFETNLGATRSSWVVDEP